MGNMLDGGRYRLYRWKHAENSHSWNFFGENSRASMMVSPGMRCRLKTTLLQNKLRWSKIMCYIGGFSLILWFYFNIISKTLAVTVFRNQLYKTSLSPWNRTLGIRFKHSTVLESGFLTLDLFKPSYWPKKKILREKNKTKQKNIIVMQRMKFPFRFVFV